MYTEAGVLTGTPVGIGTSEVDLRTGNTINLISFGPENATAPWDTKSDWDDNVFFKFNAVAADFPYGLP